MAPRHLPERNTFGRLDKELRPEFEAQIAIRSLILQPLSRDPSPSGSVFITVGPPPWVYISYTVQVMN